ncbi:MAG: restriction endonuclease subunit S [Bacteroidales bacterium]|nr:restriction endonuclease subunit S [Bacteroidales bacterium]
MQYKISEIFKVIQGHQITDEELYNSQGCIPVLTARNQIKGYWDRALVSLEDLPCLTYPTKGNYGMVFLQKEIFDANNTAVLIPKAEWRDKIDLNWFLLKLPQLFVSIQTSKEGVSYLNKDIVENLTIDIPSDFSESSNVVNKELQIKEQHNCLNTLLEHLECLLSKKLYWSYNKYQKTNVRIQECLEYLSGNSNLTEEFVYNRSIVSGKKYKILSSATQEENMLGEIPMCKINGRDLKVFENKAGLLVVRKGKAGTTLFLEPGNYTLNDDAYILYVKEDSPYIIDLKWLAIQYKMEFLNYASSSDNGTWNMTGFFKNVVIDIPSIEEQKSLVEMFDRAEIYKDKINLIQAKIQNLLNKEIQV